MALMAWVKGLRMIVPEVAVVVLTLVLVCMVALALLGYRKKCDCLFQRECL